MPALGGADPPDSSADGRPPGGLAGRPDGRPGAGALTGLAQGEGCGGVLPSTPASASTPALVPASVPASVPALVSVPASVPALVSASVPAAGAASVAAGVSFGRSEARDPSVVVCGCAGVDGLVASAGTAGRIGGGGPVGEGAGGGAGGRRQYSSSGLAPLGVVTPSDATNAATRQRPDAAGPCRGRPGSRLTWWCAASGRSAGSLAAREHRGPGRQWRARR